jgi:PAT family beta-lactamase induction signal transducer AmpG
VPTSDSSRPANDFAVAPGIAGRRFLAMLLLGLASGLPLALSGSTLQAWLTVEGVDIRTIGLYSLVALPYTFKFLWAPIMDRFVPPRFGRRRGWMIATQAALACAIATLAGLRPAEHAAIIAVLAVAIAFLSASQDVAIDAYRADVLAPRERGFGAAVFVGGYRIGMLASGAGALILASYCGFGVTFVVLGAAMGLGIATSILSAEPVAAHAPSSMLAAYREPLLEFLRRPEAGALIALIVLYKLGDAFAGTLTTAFLLRGAGFGLAEVGAISKGFGLLATIVGGLFGGAMMMRLGLYQALMLFGVLQAVTNLGFMLLSLTGKHYGLMAAVVGLENFAGGMGTAAFVALLMALCDHRYTATQYALLSACAALGRVWIGPPSGYLVDALDWTWFFLLTFIVALPGLALLARLRESVSRLERAEV